ncbi:MAG: site-specific DNA-methyltransferase [Gemmataceae bacterium]|nr:site-specific DNA-methyltransferase [Gemmataceae bacterium]
MMQKTHDVKEKSKLTKEEWREYTKTVWQIANTAHPNHPAVFPEEIPKRLIKLFSFWGETALDPFAGVGTTGHVAVSLGRKAICVDQNPEYVALMKKELGAHDKTGSDFTAVAGDSRKLAFIEDESVGVIVTSPPYWNKADYGPRAANLGRILNYQQFLHEIAPVFAECFRVLMPGRKLCVVTAHVNQHTDHGLLTFPLATDLTVLLRDLGFVLVNEIVWSKDGTGGKWGSYGKQRPIFGSYPYPPNFHFKNVHEYILILAKPPAKATKGPKVLAYSDLMQPFQNGAAKKNGETLAHNGSAATASQNGATSAGKGGKKPRIARR